MITAKAIFRISLTIFVHSFVLAYPTGVSSDRDRYNYLQDMVKGAAIAKADFARIDNYVQWPQVHKAMGYSSVQELLTDFSITYLSFREVNINECLIVLWELPESKSQIGKDLIGIVWHDGRTEVVYAVLLMNIRF
jgi:hypothetical protein